MRECLLMIDRARLRLCRKCSAGRRTSPARRGCYTPDADKRNLAHFSPNVLFRPTTGVVVVLEPTSGAVAFVFGESERSVVKELELEAITALLKIKSLALEESWDICSL